MLSFHVSGIYKALSGCLSLHFLVSDTLSQLLNLDITYTANGFQILSVEVILKTMQVMETCIQKTHTYAGEILPVYYQVRHLQILQKLSMFSLKSVQELELQNKSSGKAVPTTEQMLQIFGHDGPVYLPNIHQHLPTDVLLILPRLLAWIKTLLEVLLQH